MSIVDNIKKRMNGADDGYDDYSDDGYYAESFGSYDEAPADDADMEIGNSGMGASSSVGMGAQGLSISGNAIEMKVVKPESFDSATQIADHLLSRRTVFLNLENTNKETARRLVDFLTGVAYSIEGSLKKVAANAYVITPSNVNVGDARLTSRKAASAKPAGDESGSDDFGEY